MSCLKVQLKPAEGHAAEIAFGLARDDNVHIEVHWQDGESSSGNSLPVYYPDKTKTRVMLCGGHVGRAHIKTLCCLTQVILTLNILGSNKPYKSCDRNRIRKYTVHMQIEHV